jgi:hypothetical protein
MASDAKKSSLLPEQLQKMVSGEWVATRGMQSGYDTYLSRCHSPEERTTLD